MMGLRRGLACIVSIVLLLAAFPDNASCVSNTMMDNHGPLLTAFNCKKIAFYKVGLVRRGTDKRASPTLYSTLGTLGAVPANYEGLLQYLII